MEDLQEKYELFNSLFKGREDVFALYWEKESKKGFMPAYFFDPYSYRKHQLNGGTFQNFSGKSYLKLTSQQIAKHLEGQQLIGLYPLLADNTSWLIVADFDKQSWLIDCQNFMLLCNTFSIPAYVERSRSGNGCHVWIFFEAPYPAYKSRKVILSLLEQAGIISLFDKNTSFDRLFPNQDHHSGKGLGNLIALPLYGKVVENGNTCFIDENTGVPHPDQWLFLQTIRRISTEKLDQLFTSLSEAKSPATESGRLTITLDSALKLNKQAIPGELIRFLKDELNFLNAEFIIKKNSGKNTFGTERYFQFIEDNTNSISIPKGFTGKLLRFCKENKLDYIFNDQRKLHKPVRYTFSASLRDHQEQSVHASTKKDIGIIVAPPGSGKTIVALRIIADKQQPALIIVHRRQLAEQWSERIVAFLGIPAREIGKIAQGKVDIGKQITIATIQSLTKRISDPNLNKAFGIVIIDECHHIPAKTFHDTISKLHAYYQYGMTATPFRKYNDGQLIFIHLGDVISEIKSNEITSRKSPEIIIRNTHLDVPYNPKTDRFETLSKILVHDSERNRMLLDDVAIELNDGRKSVIITERKEHIEVLNQYLKGTYETITLSGDDLEATRASKWKRLNEGNFEVLITTGQFFGEGIDLHNIECLFLVYPFSFEGKLVQYIGRVQRAEIAPTIYDYRDVKIDYLNRLFLKRNTYYRKLEKQANLFDEPLETNHHLNAPKDLILEKQVKISIDKLEFQYGNLSFRYMFPELQQELEFDIENIHIRPEFEVLKPYFEKHLKSKTISVSLCVIARNKRIEALSAQSEDVGRFNREIIESVRFRFTAKTFFGKGRKVNPVLEENQELKTADEKSLPYESGEELLNEVLKRGKYLHHQQLIYLSQLHQQNTLKIRFVISPFAFVFLLSGQEQYHLVLETLDTEEATYIWHIEKDAFTLKEALFSIDQQLNMIRTQGRQAFLKSMPQHFSRILHDYADTRKGFIIWKDTLEERLF